MIKDIFNQSNKLMQKVLVSKVIEYPTFIYVLSVFKDPFYNFIAPTVEPKELDWSKTEEIIQNEMKNRFIFSYYIKHNEYYKKYKNILIRKGYEMVLNDSYQCIEVTKFSLDDSEIYEDADKESIRKYIDISEICFPEWNTNAEFCKQIFNKRNNLKGTFTKSFLVRDKNTAIGTGALLLNRELSLAYITNTCTLQKYRGKGIQKRLVKFLCNTAAIEGIRYAYTITEEDSISLKNFEKLGFRTTAKYDVFQRVNLKKE